MFLLLVATSKFKSRSLKTHVILFLLRMRCMISPYTLRDKKKLPYSKRTFKNIQKRFSNQKNVCLVMKSQFIIILNLFVCTCIHSQTTINIPIIDDAYIDQTIPSGNFGASDQLVSKPYAPNWSQRFLLKADLSSIPEGAQIISAEIKLTVTNYLWVSSTIGAYKINDSWSEHSVTWSNFSNDYESAPTSQKTLTYPNHSIGAQRHWDVLSDVQDMHTGAIPNKGWLFKDVNSSSSSQAYWNFASSENTSSSRRPVLVLTYLTFDPLPVEMISFSGECDNDEVHLTWQTASEQLSSHFKVDWSRDGTNWQGIGEVAAAGFSNSPKTYTLNYVPPLTANAYYRLSQYDTDGSLDVFEDKILELRCLNNSAKNVLVYPNPNTGTFNVILHAVQGTSQEGLLTIIGTDGAIVHNKKIQLNTGVNIYSIESDLQEGIYLMRIESDTYLNEVFKFVVK